eukprot:TRINITY_DN11219_c0_g1_i10.p1 TRINITY_DN11219_c0_g1~~TRINITY_DN11219_c0_g1_i10.p1  ORF type:complete len:272 (-),score=93.53 TRINITY_DN11219_c0_g1_i10:31-846(-)
MSLQDSSVSMKQLCEQLETVNSEIGLSFHQILYFSAASETYIYAGVYVKESERMARIEGSLKVRRKKQKKDALQAEKLASKEPAARPELPAESLGDQKGSQEANKSGLCESPSEEDKSNIVAPFVEDKKESVDATEEVNELAKKSIDAKIPVVDNAIRLKCRPVANKDQFTFLADRKVKTRRGKERTIKEAINLVDKWKTQKAASLEAAASIVNTSKKTLDDYYRQLKNGIERNFDFAYYRDYPIGILRHFNNQCKYPHDKTKPLKSVKTE